MEKISNNIKFCTFVNILRAYSSEDVSLSIKEINEHMNKKLGVTLDRRTVYSYIKDMRQLGMEVSQYSKEKEGYFLTDEFFKNHELKLLMDSIKSSNFITKKKTDELLEKLSKLSYIYRGEKVKSDVFIDDTSKITNEEIYDNLEIINKAIKNNKKITFKYLDDHVEYNQVDFLTINPICIINDYGNYHLVSIYDNLDEITAFRIDKIIDLEISEEDVRELKSIPESSHRINPSDYINKSFEDYIKQYLEDGGDHGTGY